MTFSVEEIQDGPPGGADVSVRLTGDNLEQLGQIAREISQRLKQVRGVVDVSTDYRDEAPELVVEPMPNVVGLFDMDEARIAAAVQTAIAGNNRIQITLDDEDVDIRVQLAPEYRRGPDDLKRLMLTAAGGRRRRSGSWPTCGVTRASTASTVTSVSGPWSPSATWWRRPRPPTCSR